MILVIQGGSGSGKSAYAEQRAMQLAKETTGRLYYLATMQVYDQEGRRKVEKHKQQRAGKSFITIEQPGRIGEAIYRMEEQAVVLVECLSNLVANEMFDRTGDSEQSLAEDHVTDGLVQLADRAAHLILVTNNVFEDGICYEPETNKYIHSLGLVNQRIAAMADEVIEVVAGLPVFWKGG